MLEFDNIKQNKKGGRNYAIWYFYAFLAGAALHFYDKAQQSTNQRIYELNTILARNCPEIYGEIWLCNIDTKLLRAL